MERVSHYGVRGKKLYAIQDVAVAVENMMLQAHELDLGSVWVGAFDEGAVSGILDLPEWLVPMAVVPIGYPASLPSAPRRLEIDEIVTVI
jgi:nitroreductase